MQSSLQHPINEVVCAYELFTGGEEEGVRGRQRSKKRLVIVAVEIVEKEDGSNGMGRAYARVIPNGQANHLRHSLTTISQKKQRLLQMSGKGMFHQSNIIRT